MNLQEDKEQLLINSNASFNRDHEYISNSERYRGMKSLVALETDSY